MRRNALAFILLSVLIDTMGFGIILPVTPDLIVLLGGGTVAEASATAGWLLVVYAALQFFCGPIIGNLGDHFGRRPVLLASLFAFGVDYLLMGLAPSLPWLFLGRAVAGLAGAAFSPAYAYVADISPPEQRARSFGLVGAAFGLGFILGPALGGWLGNLGPRAPFLAAAVLALTNVLYGLVVLPESLPPERRRTFDWRRANVLGTFRSLRADALIARLAVAVLLWQVATQVYPSTWAFFTKLKFGWTSGQIGTSLAAVGLAMALVQGLATGRVIARLGEWKAMRLGLVAGTLGLVATALVPYGWMLYGVFILTAFQGVAYPSMNAVMSQRCPPDAQGELQGGVSSLLSLSSILGPLLMTQVLRHFSEAEAPVFLPGAPYLLAAGLGVACLVMVSVGRLRSTATEPA